MPISPGHDDEHVDGAAAGAEVGTQPVVEHHPCAAERPGHRLTLAWRRVEAVVVPELHLARSPGFATRYRACGVRRTAPGEHRRDHAGGVSRLRIRAGRAQRRQRSCPPAGQPPATMPLSRLVNSLKGVPSRRFGRSSRISCGTAGAPSARRPAPTSPSPSAMPPPRSCASTSSSKTAPASPAHVHPPSPPA